MSISISDFRIAIRIDNSEAKIKFGETRDQIDQVTAAMKKLEAEGKKNSAEYKELQAQQDKLNKSLYGQRKEAGLTTLSYDELRKGYRTLKAQMDKITPGTEKWEKIRADALLTKRRMKELEVQATETRFSISKVADGFNKYAAIGASAVASLTGVVLTARKCVEEYAEMEEAESQVRKYTGMAREEVKGLNEDFKQMDTRSPRTELNRLAGEAGKLGISGKKDVLEFVDAANMINVALGEDLGEDAVKNIGKLAQMFGEDDRLGLRGAMLATGSAINEVAQNSSAAEAYLVGFMGRVSGAANQAKVAQGDIIGYASVLDQNMQQQEMAATAFQTLMMKMYQEPAKFAKLAGQNVAEFTSLIKNDANEAILLFLDSLNKKGGLDKLAPMFKEMGLDGVRASGVISTMAGKIDDIRAAQKLANDAYRDGTSIINEYNIQNNTVQAELEKAKKKFADIRVELGEQLMPVMKHMITTGRLTVEGLSAIISIIGEYKGAISGALVVIASWIAYKKTLVAWTKLETWWNNSAETSFKKLKKTMSANIYGVILVAIGSYIGKMIEARSRQDELKESLSGMKKVNHETTKSFIEQEAKIRSLNTVINDSGVALNERRKALGELKTIIPGYNAMLTDEGTLTKNNTNAIKDYLVLLEKEIKLKAAKEELEELYKKERTLTNDETAQSDEYWDIRQKNTLSGYNRNGFAAKVSRLFGTENEDKALKKLTETRKELQSVAGQIEEINKEISQSSVEVEKLHTANGNTGDGKCAICGNKPCTCGNNAGGDSDSKDKKPWVARLQTAENAYKEELLLLRKNSDSRSQTETEYQMDALQSEMEYQAKRLSIIKHYQSIDGDKKHLAELGKLESESKTAIYNSLKDSENARLTLHKDFRDRRLNTVTDGEKKVQLEQSKLYEAGELSEKDYKNRLLAIEMTALYSRLEIAQDYQADVADMEFQNGEVKAKAVKEAGNSVLDIERQISEKRASIAQSSVNQIQNFNSQFNKTNGLASMDQQLSSLQTFYDSQIALAKKNGIDTTLLTTVYEEAKRKIIEKGAEDRADVIRKYDLSAAEDTKNLKLKALEEEHRMGLLSEEEYEIAKNKINNEYLQERLGESGKYFDAVAQIMGNVSSAIQGFQDAEISEVTRKYDKQIKAAKKAGKDTTKLEEEKEEAINQVKKKYANKQFAASVLQVAATTAVAAIQAYNAMLSLGPVGVVLAPIAAAAAVAAGMAQLASAKQARDEAKGLKEGGYSKEYVEGFTQSGNPDDVAGVIPVHKNEFVTNHEGVANPNVRQFLDVFDVAQKNGTIRMINTTQILEQVRTRSGKYSGGYIVNDSTPLSVSGISSGISNLPPEERRQVVLLLQENNRLLGILCNKDLVVDPRQVRDGIKRIEQLERNVSRG